MKKHVVLFAVMALLGSAMVYTTGFTAGPVTTPDVDVVTKPALTVTSEVAPANVLVGSVWPGNGYKVNTSPNAIRFVFKKPVDILPNGSLPTQALTLSQGIFLYAAPLPNSSNCVWNFFISGITVPGRVDYTLTAGHAISRIGTQVTNKQYDDYFILTGSPSLHGPVTQQGVAVPKTSSALQKTPATAPKASTPMTPTIAPRFVLENGMVRDKNTGLMWAPSDNGSSIDWLNAKTYCLNYHGGGYSGWRMPTTDELAALYAGGAHKDKITLTGHLVWASETQGPEGSNFRFDTGTRHWLLRSYALGRALPVRSGK